LAISILATSALVAQNKAANGASAPAIDSEKIRAHVKFLASDLLEGRGTGQRGGDVAAEYIATQFRLYGLQPGGENGSYFQDVPMMSVKTLPETAFKLVPANGEALTLKNLDDFVTNNESQAETADLDAPIVFVGYGITAPEYRWDDYKGRRPERQSCAALCQREGAHLLRPLDLQIRRDRAPRGGRHTHHSSHRPRQLRMASGAQLDGHGAIASTPRRYSQTASRLVDSSGGRQKTRRTVRPGPRQTV
jgi:hypothetical protein